MVSRLVHKVVHISICFMVFGWNGGLRCACLRASVCMYVYVCVCVYVCVVGLWYLELFEVGGSESRPPMIWHRDVSLEIRTELPVCGLGDFSRKMWFDSMS